MFLGCTVVSTVTRVRSLVRSAPLVRHPQALGQQQLQLVAEPLAPMAQVRALVREVVLEELLAGEVLEIRVIDPALAHAFVGQSVNVLEQQQPDHEAGLDPRPALLAVERRDLAVDPVPIDLAGELHQLVLQVDDLVEPRPEQIVRSRRLVLLRPHRPLRCTAKSWFAAKGNPQIKLQDSVLPSSKSLQSQTPPQPKNKLLLNRLEVVHGRLFLANGGRLSGATSGSMSRMSRRSSGLPAASPRTTPPG